MIIVLAPIFLPRLHYLAQFLPLEEPVGRKKKQVGRGDVDTTSSELGDPSLAEADGSDTPRISHTYHIFSHSSHL